MRAPSSLVRVAVMTSRRRWRAASRGSWWVVMLSRLPVTLTAGCQACPSGLRLILKSRVFQAWFSPPAPACFSTTLVSVALLPRSTCSHLAPCEHHLSLKLPPRKPACLIRKPVTSVFLPRSTCSHFPGASEHHLSVSRRTLPSTALPAPYSGPQGFEPVARLPRATSGGAASKEGGASAAAAPQVRSGVAPMVSARVVPPARSAWRSQARLVGWLPTESFCT